MITYRHESFVAQAIESVLAQQADFAIELVIGEDCSPDKTAEVIRSFASTDRLTIRSRFNSPNLGMMANFARTLEECTGEYIALLEGDDYWTDTSKLQRQVDFLDGNAEFAICFHPVDVLQGGRLGADTRTREVAENTDIHDLALGNYMHTCSVMFRAGLFPQFPPSFLQATAGDYFLHMLNARFGRIGKLKQKMAVYRVHADGAWSTDANMDLKILTYLECMIGLFQTDIDEALRARHRDIAFRSFIKRIQEPGVTERMDRCLRFGTAEFAQRIVPWLTRAKALDEHCLLRIFRRFL